MKTAKWFWVLVTIGALFSVGLTACGKKNEDTVASVSGSLVSDGQQISTNGTTVQGQVLNLSIRNVNASSTYMNCYQQPCYNGTVRFELNINGFATQAQATSNWSSFVRVQNWWVATQGACLDQNCQTTLLTLVLTPYNAANQYTEFRQIAVKQDRYSNKVIAMREYTINSLQGIRSLPQLQNDVQ